MKFPTYKEIGEKVAKEALDTVEYNGKTLREWIEIISATELDTDCISRQAAVDAIDEISNEVADGYGFDYAKWREYFCELPPAQPEIIRCKDCEWWEKQKDSSQGRCELMRMYPTGGWYCGNAQRRMTE